VTCRFTGHRRPGEQEVTTNRQIMASPRQLASSDSFSHLNPLVKGNSMKRMKYLAATAGLGPLALGLAQTAPATAATANHNAAYAPTSSKKVLTSGKQCDRNVCIEVFGSGNAVSKVTEWITNPTKRPDTFQVWARTPVDVSSHIWKQAYGGSWQGTKSHTWYPACSWSGTFYYPTIVRGHATRAAGSPRVSVYGGSYTGKHQCGFIS
jgi:hypothetical protein